MSGEERSAGYLISRSRLEALVDAIFAFAMTLLVTGLVIAPFSKSEAASELSASIVAMYPQFFSFLIAFFVLAAFWLGHHRLFCYVHSVDMVLVRINLLILAFVVLVPFTTNISGDFSGVQIAVDLFHANIFILGLLFCIHWWYLIHNPRLTSAEIGNQDAATGMRRVLVVPFVSGLGLVLSFGSPSWSMAVYMLIPLSIFIIQRSSKI